MSSKTILFVFLLPSMAVFIISGGTLFVEALSATPDVNRLIDLFVCFYLSDKAVERSVSMKTLAEIHEEMRHDRR